jgi:restriction system protein
MAKFRYWHRRRKKPEDFATLLIAVLILSIFLPPVRQVITSSWYLYAILIIVLLFSVAIRINHRIKLSKAGIYEVDKMSGTDFEIFLSDLFSKLGYKTQRVGHSGDLGSDLILEMDGIRIALQAKRYKEQVGPDAVREVNTVLRPRNCTLGMVVTNSFYTDEAKYLARENNITLWDRNDLINNILRSKKGRLLNS